MKAFKFPGYQNSAPGYEWFRTFTIAVKRCLCNANNEHMDSCWSLQWFNRKDRRYWVIYEMFHILNCGFWFWFRCYLLPFASTTRPTHCCDCSIWQLYWTIYIYWNSKFSAYSFCNCFSTINQFGSWKTINTTETCMGLNDTQKPRINSS